MLTAKIALEYSSASFAKSVMIALNPDNQFSKGQMRVITGVSGRKLIIAISRCPTLETMRSTLEDIFRCAKAAQESMSLAEGKKDHGKVTKDKRFK